LADPARHHARVDKTRRDPRGFPIDDRRVYDAYIAGRMSAALAAGVRIGLFDRLDRGPASAAELAAELRCGERPMRSLVGALRAMGLVEPERGGRFRLAPDAAQYAVRGKPGSLCGLIDLEVENYLSPARLLAALHSGTTSVYGSIDPWERHAADPAAARAFTAAMHSVSERAAAGLAEVADMGDVRAVLDVGGGSGALSIALARAWPRLHCTILDLPTVCEAAEEYIAAAGVADRVRTRAGNMFADALPDGFDAVLYSQILHDWPFEKGDELLRRAFAALPGGGRVMVHEKLVDDDGSGPLANALVHLDMLVWTEGQQYTEGELRRALAAAGFARVERRATAGYWSLVTGHKP
jgi:hypothetical protein